MQSHTVECNIAPRTCQWSPNETWRGWFTVEWTFISRTGSGKITSDTSFTLTDYSKIWSDIAWLQMAMYIYILSSLSLMHRRQWTAWQHITLCCLPRLLLLHHLVPYFLGTHLPVNQQHQTVGSEFVSREPRLRWNVLIQFTHTPNFGC